MERENRQEKLLKTLKDYQTWQLVLILILFSFVVMILLRLNNTGMVSRKEAAIAADKEGNPEHTKNRLADLQNYVTKHMNASTGRFFLEGQYQRDLDAAVEAAKVAATHNPHGNVYKKASEVCDSQFTVRTAAYFQCYMNEIAKYPQIDYGEAQVKIPNSNLYQIEYSSPRWTLDWAGIAVLLWLFLTGVIIIRLLVKGILLIVLKKQKISG